MPPVPITPFFVGVMAVPIVLLAMAAAEASAASAWLIWAGGLSLLIGRVMHGATLPTRGLGAAARTRHDADAGADGGPRRLVHRARARGRGLTSA